MCTLAATDRGAPRPHVGLVRASEVEGELARERSAPNYTAETLAVPKARLDPQIGLIFLISGELASGPDPQFGRWYRLMRSSHMPHLRSVLVRGLWLTMALSPTWSSAVLR